ncbi:Connector enhancer of kinase suppressor of ras 2 [Halotydeus destructor]|nr:Connector enhancer of kinase suppressor of ras 2 [Halotydeus destructor]
MAFVNVAEWSPENVADWLKGLDDSILPYVQFFLNNNVNGCKLVLLTSDDLEKLNVHKIGHQELILEGVDLLRHLHYNSASETLQTQALRLGCKARSLFNQLKHDELDSSEIKGKHQDRVSTSTLSSVSDILVSVKSFVSWLDRYPFCTQDQYLPVRKAVLRYSIELASTAQRDQFVDKPNQVIKVSCLSLADLCDRIVQDLHDSLAIQPASLEVVAVKKRQDDDLGLHIFSSYSGIHIVGGIKQPSPSHRCGRIEEGDEIVQINYQTVVGWTLKKLVSTMKEHPTEILLTMKKRPRHSPIMGQVILMKPYKIPARKSYSKSQTSRLRSAATATTVTNGGPQDTDDEDFEKSLKEQVKGPVYMPSRKPRHPVRRRATISGSSPTVPQAPIRIEDLVPNSVKAKPKDQLGRSPSYDLTKSNCKLSPCLPNEKATATALVPLMEQVTPGSPKPKKQVPSPVINNGCNNNSNDKNMMKPVFNGSNSSIVSTIGHSGSNMANNTNSPQVPYVKVQPLPAVERSSSIRLADMSKVFDETIPKQIVNSSIKHVYDTVAPETGCNYDSVVGPSPAVDRSCKPPLPAKPRPGQNVGVVIPSHCANLGRAPPLPMHSPHALAHIHQVHHQPSHCPLVPTSCHQQAPTPQPRVSKQIRQQLPLAELPPKPALPPKASTCSIVGEMKKQHQGQQHQLKPLPSVTPIECQSTELLIETLNDSVNALELECPSSPDNKSFSPLFEHVIPKEHRARLGVAVDESIFEDQITALNCSTPESGYLSQSMSTLLDKEYERVFGGRQSAESNLKSIVPASCGPLNRQLHAMNQTKMRTGVAQSSESDTTTTSDEPHVYSLRAHTPTSDSTLSSHSSGISSYHSAYTELPVPKQFTNHVYEKLPPKPGRMRHPSDPKTEAEARPAINLPVKSSSFRFFNSPKLLRKFSSPKYQKERRHDKKDIKHPLD